MLFSLNTTIDFIGTCLSIWLGLYLLGRGFPSRITLRAVVALLALAVFFFTTYINLYVHIPGAGPVIAALLTIGLVVWCDLSDIIFQPQAHRKMPWLVRASYGFAYITIVLLLWARNDFAEEAGKELWILKLDFSLPYIFYGIFMQVAGVVILYNLLSTAKVRSSLQNRYFLMTTSLMFALVGYGMLVLESAHHLPRLIQDVVVFISVILLGSTVAGHQTLVERRTTLQDFFISALAIFGLSAVYILAAWQWSHSPILLVLVAALAILTHSTYDLIREFINLLRHNNESQFRTQLHRLENHIQGDNSLQARLQEGINLLCQILRADEGFIAIRQENMFIVSASYHSIQVGSALPVSTLICEDICEPAADLSRKIAWLAPAFEAGDQVAVIGLGPSRIRHHYSNDDLDLLAEAADRVGTIVYLYSLQPRDSDRLMQVVSDIQSREENLRIESDELIATLVTKPDPEFVEMVEDGLRHLSDFITLGQFSLAENLGVPGETVIERGKAVQKQLIRAIEMLRPEKLRPEGPLPREWYSYVVLHDAYIEEVPNRDIMARLYISEGTFNRTRRKALRGIARFLLEKKEP